MIRIKQYLLECLLFFLLLTSLTRALSAPATYQLILDPNSPLKNVSLKNTTLIIKVFMDGTPQGIQTVSTDSNGQFSLPQNYDVPITVRVISIANKINSNEKCCGVSTPNSQVIMIMCSNAQQLANTSCDH